MKTTVSDILNCLANLSSDEVFTSPELANRMLDMLPQELFRNPDTKFLDPCSKSGVFLREIAKRLMVGLEAQIPDLQQRIDHIMRKQLFGIALTQLTAEMSRRTLYCTKKADGDYSVATCFKDGQGNLHYMRCEHIWANGKCSQCGANRAQYDRVETIENYAYPFIHKNLNEIFKNMQFDVIIGNPPYQMSDSGAFASASPIYHHFVLQSIKLQPRYLVMIIPSRWFAGGKGLDDFRRDMLNDDRITELHDFEKGSDCFPDTRIAGGVCYFRWERDKHDDCDVYCHSGNKITSHLKRPLLEKDTDTFIRINEAIPILRKVQTFHEKSFSVIVSGLKPFGLRTDFFNDPSKYNLPPIFENPITKGITIIGTYKYKTENRYVPANYPFPTNAEKIGKYKVYVSNVLDNGFDWHRERLKPFLGLPNTVCTETFLCAGYYETKEEAENVISYMNTKFFHLLMFLKKVSHHVVSKVYQFVPLQDFSHPWTDEKLYEKYGLSEDEIAFIESMIKPME